MDTGNHNEPDRAVLNIELDPGSRDYLKYKEKELDLNYGLLGKVFGDSQRSPSNIAGAVLLLSTVAGLVITIYPGGTTATEAWKVISPIIVGTMGFLFGRNH
jgi:hypothetical protein